MRKTLLSASVAAVSLTPATALAQTVATPAAAPDQSPPQSAADSGFGDIIVTAQRREQSLLSVPVAVTALGGDQLVRKGIVDTSRLAASIPNLQVSSAFGKSQPNFTIRGIGVGNEFNSNQASPVGVYIDDAYIASRTSQGVQLYDLQRVEVLRGPQGTLFGRNTTGGAISIVTRAPGLAGTEGYVEGGYGNYNAAHAQAALELTPVDGVLGIRAVANFDRSDANFRNVHPGAPDANGGKSYSGRVAVRIEPTDKLRVDLKAYGGRNNLHQSPFQPIGVNAFTGYSRAGLGFDEVDQDHPGYRRDNAWGFLARETYEASDNVTINALTSYDGGAFEVNNDGDGTPADLLPYNPTSRTRQFNQELRLNYAKDRVNLTVGAYYGTDTNWTRNRFAVFPFLEGLGAPADPTGQTGGFTIDQRFKQFRQSTAIFSQLDYTLTDHLSVSAGIRYTWDKAKLEDALAYLGDYHFNPLFYSVTDPAHCGSPVPTLQGKSSAPTGRAALTYTFDSKAIIYASYNRGYRAGTFSGGAYISNTQLQYVKPETVDAWEVGTKGRLFGGSVTYALDAFYMRYRNQQTNETIGVATFLRNAGKATIYGGELELTARPMPDLILRGSLGYLHTRYDELTLGQDTATNNPGVNLAGNQLPFAPKLTAQAGADWEVGEVGGGNVTFSPQVSYLSRLWFTPYGARESFVGDPVGNGGLSQRGYALVDATLSWSDQRITVNAWVRNLFQKHYNVYGLYLRNTTGSDLLTPGEPRTFGLTARYEF
ncbi:MAG: TonB-dependent receptor [Novosphingobium sp.]|nr:TonB-dependent receptor [Novosphingobium sp.]